jgi:hypothetical protein
LRPRGSSPPRSRASARLHDRRVGGIPTAAAGKAEQEYARYHALLDAQPRAIDAEFDKVAKQLKKPAAPRGKKRERS